MVVTSLALIARQSPASACATATREGATIETATETALIVWDEAKKREHFIRGATFAGSAREAAFLVPTPSLPELAAVTRDPFEAITERAAPARETQSKWGVSLMPLCLSFFLLRSMKSEALPAGVQILSRQRVGNYDATVLRGTSAAAITQWLAENRFPSRPALDAWLAPYVAQGFFFTAFRLAEDPQQGGLAATTVRLSFDTPRPFYPYREPDDTAPHPGRLLRLAFVGNGTPRAKIGDDAWIPPKFSGELGRASWASPVPLPEGAAWLTVYEDDVTGRRGLGDVSFLPTTDRTVITPPPIIDTVQRDLPLPLDVVAGLGLVGGLAVWISRRRKEDAPSV